MPKKKCTIGESVHFVTPQAKFFLRYSKTTVFATEYKIMYHSWNNEFLLLHIEKITILHFLLRPFVPPLSLRNKNRLQCVPFVA